MESLHYDYGYVNKLGQFFIPRYMQEHSKMKCYVGGFLTTVVCAVEGECIVLTFRLTVTKEEYLELKKTRDKNADKEICGIDEIGRVILPKRFMKQVQIYPPVALISYLIDERTIKIRSVIAVTDHIIDLKYGGFM